jgi:hypothetical protein
MIRRGFVVAFSLSLGLCAPAVLGEETRYSDYEKETVGLALDDVGAEIDPSPEGKRVAGVDIVVFDVIEDRDPVPNFLNWFHVTSKDYTLRRELLIVEGAIYDDKLVRETERNLRALRQLSLVVIVPVKGARPDEVRLLVVAKDIWSLRLNSNYVIQEGKLLELFLQPSEENLFGTHRRLLGNFLYEPDTITTGLRFIDPRMAGSRVTWLVDGNVIVNHASGEVEGSAGTAQYGQPLFSLSTDWSWGAVVSWRHETTRRFVGTEIDTFDADITPGDDMIPFVYDSETINGRVSVTRSLGYEVKNDFTLGVGADRRVFRTPDLSAFHPAAVGEFRDKIVPRTETSNGPFLQHRFFLNRFASLLDVEAMGLQENYLLGPELFWRISPRPKALASTRNVVAWSTTAAFTETLGSGLGRVYLSGGAEHDLDRDVEIRDAFVQGGLRMVSPSFFAGRLVYDGTVLYRPRNYQNRLVSVGGDGRLRGYPSQRFIGENLVASNLELRSRSFQVLTVLVGGSLFYDVGDAFDGEKLEVKHGAGFGLRMLFPQLGRSVMRVDWGFAIEPEPGASIFDGLIITFGQAFGMPSPDATGVSLAN